MTGLTTTDWRAFRGQTRESDRNVQHKIIIIINFFFTRRLLRFPGTYYFLRLFVVKGKFPNEILDTIK